MDGFYLVVCSVAVIVDRHQQQLYRRMQDQTDVSVFSHPGQQKREQKKENKTMVETPDNNSRCVLSVAIDYSYLDGSDVSVFTAIRMSFCSSNYRDDATTARSILRSIPSSHLSFYGRESVVDDDELHLLTGSEVMCNEILAPRQSS